MIYCNGQSLPGSRLTHAMEAVGRASGGALNAIPFLAINKNSLSFYSLPARLHVTSLKAQMSQCHNKALLSLDLASADKSQINIAWDFRLKPPRFLVPTKAGTLSLHPISLGGPPMLRSCSPPQAISFAMGSYRLFLSLHMALAPRPPITPRCSASTCFIQICKVPLKRRSVRLELTCTFIVASCLSCRSRLCFLAE